MIDLTDKSFVIFGLRGSGKSWLVKSILDSTADHIIYDPLNEHKGYRQYIPDDRESVEELSEMIQGLVIKQKPSLFIIDEANKYIPPKPTRLCSGVADLVDFSRHFGISFGAVARRPSQFHTDLVELADYVLIFNLPGKNDFQYCEALFRGLGSTVRNLPPYHYACLKNGREIEVHSPVEKPLHPAYT